MRIAVLGTGRIGRMHADNIANHRELTLSVVQDIYEPSAKEVAERHSARQANDAEEVFGASDVDAILIASATATHADYIERAVAAGKPVLCEKPIDLSLERVNQCADKVHGSGVPIQIGFNRRFDPGHRAAKEALNDGDIGDLHQVIITSRDPEMPPRSYYETAGGLMRDMTIHDFDLARYMLGEEPTEVIAIAGAQADPGMMGELDDHDSAMITMRTASGTQCFINNSRCAVYGYDQRVELMGSQGMVQSENIKETGFKQYSRNAVETARPYPYFFMERYRSAFLAELDSFIAAVNSGSEPEVTFEDGRRALVLAEAAYRSVAEGRIVQVAEVDNRAPA